MRKERHMIRLNLSIAAALGIIIGTTTTSALAHEDDKLEEIVVSGRWDLRPGLAVSASEGVVGQSELDLRHG